MEVRTYDNRRVPVSEMTHQHLSNWCWYNKIVLGKSDEDIPMIFDELIERFEGELLPYRPKKDFYYEIGFLYSKGMINEKGEIIYENHVIGEIDG